MPENLNVTVIQRGARMVLLSFAVDGRGFEAEPALEWMFRQFNRVDGKEAISLFGVKMCSLSVGDEVEFDASGIIRRYRCASFGWEEMRWRVRSPDGLPLDSDDPAYASHSAAANALRGWAQRYREQGYYLTARGELLPADEIAEHCELVPVVEDAP